MACGCVEQSMPTDASVAASAADQSLRLPVGLGSAGAVKGTCLRFRRHLQMQRGWSSESCRGGSPLLVAANHSSAAYQRYQRAATERHTSTLPSTAQQGHGGAGVVPEWRRSWLLAGCSWRAQALVLPRPARPTAASRPQLPAYAVSPPRATLTQRIQLHVERPAGQPAADGQAALLAARAAADAHVAPN